MRTALLDVLVDPVDGGALALDPAADPPVLRSAGGRDYPVLHGVPRLLPESTPADQADTADTFGSKWSLVTDDDRDRMAAFQYRWFEQRFGWGDEERLGRHLRDCGRVLDAGCGMGYDAARYARLTEGAVIGFDLSPSVVAAQQAFGEAPNLQFVQADIMRMPLPRRSFDFVVSDQVIHHTPDTVRAFRELADLVRPGGQLSVYVYKRKGLLRELADDHVRELTTRMSKEDCLRFSEQITELGRELSRLEATITLEHGIPLLGIEPGEHDVQRLIYWSFLKCFWKEEWGQELSALTNFDWYHPPFASRHTPEEVERWCVEAGLAIVHLDVIESGISVRAARPT